MGLRGAELVLPAPGARHALRLPRGGLLRLEVVQEGLFEPASGGRPRMQEIRQAEGIRGAGSTSELLRFQAAEEAGTFASLWYTIILQLYYLGII